MMVCYHGAVCDGVLSWSGMWCFINSNQMMTNGNSNQMMTNGNLKDEQ